MQIDETFHREQELITTFIMGCMQIDETFHIALWWQMRLTCLGV